MRPRLVLHLAALVLPLAAVVGASIVLDGYRMLFDAEQLRLLAILAAAAVAAAQMAAALGGRWLLRAESRWLVPLSVGFGMALLTHVLFALLSLGFMGLAGDGIATQELFRGAPFVAVVSVVFVGWISAPLTMAVGVLVDRLQRRELARAAA